MGQKHEAQSQSHGPYRTAANGLDGACAGPPSRSQTVGRGRCDRRSQIWMGRWAAGGNHAAPLRRHRFRLQHQAWRSSLSRRHGRVQRPREAAAPLVPTASEHHEIRVAGFIANRIGRRDALRAHLRWRSARRLIVLPFAKCPDHDR
jgi:hypothetical protein